MAVLLDTNILLRLLEPQHPHSAMTERALNILRRRKEVLNIASQNLVECWAVMTRPSAENGLGFSVKAALAELEKFKRLFILLPELPLQDAWERLVISYRVSGKNTHDARLVAAMAVHRIDSVLTFNVQDFTKYSDITVLDPQILI